jgi:hypothetical protein
MEPLTALTFVLAILLLGWGHQIGFRQRSSLVPGGVPDRIKDPQAYLRWIGANLMVTGVLGLVDGLLQALVPATHTTMFLSYGAVILPIMGIRIVLGKKRYEIQRERGG